MRGEKLDAARPRGSGDLGPIGAARRSIRIREFECVPDLRIDDDLDRFAEPTHRVLERADVRYRNARIVVAEQPEHRRVNRVQCRWRGDAFCSG